MIHKIRERTGENVYRTYCGCYTPLVDEATDHWRDTDCPECKRFGGRDADPELWEYQEYLITLTDEELEQETLRHFADSNPQKLHGVPCMEYVRRGKGNVYRRIYNCMNPAKRPHYYDICSCGQEYLKEEKCGNAECLVIAGGND